MASIQSTDKVIEKYSATAFVEQRTTINEETIRGSSFDTPAATVLTNTDAPWGLEHFLSKPQMVGKNIPWPATTVPGNSLYSGYLPDIFLNTTNGIPSDFLNQMTFYRAGFRIKVTLNASQFHAGKLLITFHPALLGTGSAASFQNGYDTLQYETSLPHVTMNAEQSTSAELDIPFSMLSSMYSRFDNATNMSIGFLKVKVLNQLRTFSSAPQTVYLTIFCTLISPEVHVPIASNATVINPTFLRYDKQCPLFNDTEAQGLEVGASSSAANTSGNTGAISQLMSAASSGAAAFAQAETNPIGAIKSGIDATESAISGFSNLFAGKFDYPNDTVNPDTFMRMTTQNLALGGKAHNTSYELDIYPKQLHTVPFSYFGATRDPMFVDDLVKLPTYVSTYQWTESQASGTQIFGFRINPAVFVNEIASDTVNYSWLSSISSHYRLWRGSIRVYMQVIASRFHSGRLVGIWSPHGSVNNPSSDLASQTQSPYFVWDIQEDKELIIDLPYNMNMPWLNVVPPGVASGIDTVSKQQYLSYSGIFQLYVQNTLIGPADVNNTVDINLWFSAGPDFKLKIPVSPNMAYAWSRWTPPSVLDNDTEAQALDVEPEDGTEQLTQKEIPSQPASVVLQNEDNQSSAPVDILNYGEDYSHIKDLMRRYTKAYGYHYIFPSTQPQNSRAVMTLPVSPSITPDLLLGSNTGSAEGAGYYVSHLDHFSSHFAFWSGKINYVVCIYSPNPCVAYITHFPDRYYDAFAGMVSKLDTNYNTLRFDVPNYATVMFNTTTQQAMPVTVPWTQAYPACLTDYDLTARDDILDNPSLTPRINHWDNTKSMFFNGTLGINVDSATAQTVTVEIYIAAGDDFQTYYPTAPPVMTPLTTPTAWPTTTLRKNLSKDFVDSFDKLKLSTANITYLPKSLLSSRFTHSVAHNAT